LSNFKKAKQALGFAEQLQDVNMIRQLTSIAPKTASSPTTQNKKNNNNNAVEQTEAAWSLDRKKIMENHLQHWRQSWGG